MKKSTKYSIGGWLLIATGITREIIIRTVDPSIFVGALILFILSWGELDGN